jgi:hypothetical protein
MADKKSRRQSSIETLRHGGLLGLSRQLALYLARRLAWRSDAWSKTLTFKTSHARLFHEYGSLIKRNEIFRDRHKEQRCFVIGNGPSLKHQDLSPLKNELTLVTNSFYLHPIIGESWQPDYYFLSDPQYFGGEVDLKEFSNLTAHIQAAPFFVPHYARDFLLETAALPAERTYYVAAFGGAEDIWRAKPDLARVMPGAQTVVQLAIMAAMYMGCSPIYLLGLDHDWLAHGGEHLNFYSGQDVDTQPDGNLPGWTYEDMMNAMLTMWSVYKMLHRMGQSEGIEIINATRGGFLDVFPRGDYEHLVGIAGKSDPPLQPQR